MAWADPIIWCIVSFSFALLLWYISKNGSSRRQPPGPPGWPLIGNIFDMGLMPHQNLYKLRSMYGPVLWLKLGTRSTLVVQSAKAAEQLFKKHDLVFSDRRVFDSLTACGYDKGSLASARYGEYWRTVRKLCSSELFVQKRISASAPLRQDCIDMMIRSIKTDAAASRANGEKGDIKLHEYLFLMAFNLVSRFLLSKDVMDLKSERGNKFYKEMNAFVDWNGRPNLVDTFPFLRGIDPQGIRRNTGKHFQELFNIALEFVRERVHEKLSGKQNATKDFLDSLLEYEGEGKGTPNLITERNLIIIVLEMFFAGTETTSSTIQWGMAELLRNPDSLRKLQEELDRVIGRSRIVLEEDLNTLPYLQAVVKETMRLHPSLPLLLPRNAMEDTEYMGYFIPKNTMVLLNVWAIHRDPDSWDDPLAFKPERFLGSNIESKGQHYQLIPFGSGRRSCVGMLLGEKMVSLTLARLIQSFDWKLPDKVKPETMDVREKMGIALRMMEPLIAIPVESKP